MTPYLTENGSWTAHVNGSAALMSIRYLHSPATSFARGVPPLMFSQIVSLAYGDNPGLCSNST
jgi:hypothetical protein